MNVKESFREVSSASKQIFAWSLFNIFVGYLICAIQSFLRCKFRILGSILSFIIDLSCAALTYFAIPLIIYKKYGSRLA